MTPYTPPIRTQTDLEDLWHELLAPLGFSSMSLWLLFIGDDDCPLPRLLEIAETDEAPTTADQDSFARFLREVADEAPPGARIACLRSRPGTDEASDEDRQWAQLVYDAARAAGLGCEVVHLANDVRLLPLPLDDLPLSHSA